MAFTQFKVIDLGTISPGSTVSSQFDADDDYIIKRMYVVEYTATPVGLQFLTGTFHINKVPFTRDEVPLSLFGGYTNQVPELNLTFNRGFTFSYSVKNNHSSSSIAAYLILELHKP